MTSLRNRFAADLRRDDLFIRVSLFVFGLGSLALGGVAAHWLVSSRESPWGWLVLVGAVASLFLLWGCLASVGAFTSPSSRWSKVAEKFYPDPAGLDDAAFLLFVVLLPAALMTLVLRAFGVRGYAT